MNLTSQNISSDKIQETLFLLGFDFTKNQKVGINYFNHSINDFSWKTYGNQKPFAKAIINKNYFSDSRSEYGITRHVNSNVIVFDYDGDHHSDKFSSKAEQIFYSNMIYDELNKILGQLPNFTDRSDSGNWHAYYKFSRALTKFEKTQLLKYIQTTLNCSWLEIASDNKPFRLPASGKYHAVKSNNLNLKVDNFTEVVNLTKSIDIEKLLKKFNSNNVSEDPQKVFIQHKSTSKTHNKISIENIEFTKGARSTIIFNAPEEASICFHVYVECGKDVQKTAEWFLEHNIDSRGFSGPEAYDLALKIAEWTEEHFDENKFSGRTFKTTKNDLQKEHLNLFDYNSHDALTSHISTIIFNHMYSESTFKYAKRHEEAKRAVQELTRYYLTYIQFFYTDIKSGKEINKNAKLRHETKTLLSKSFSLYKEYAAAYLKQIGIKNLKIKNLLNKFEKALLDLNVIKMTLKASNVPGMSYKNQYTYTLKHKKTLMNNLVDLLQHILNELKETKDNKELKEALTINISNNKIYIMQSSLPNQAIIEGEDFDFLSSEFDKFYQQE